MRGMVHDTLAEMLDRKVIWVYVILTVLALLTVFGLRALENLEIQGQELDLTEMSGLVGDFVLRFYDNFMYILVFLSVLATAGLLPNMLIKGRSDFYLAKPLSRTHLLAAKVLSIWIVYGLLAAVAVLIQWLAVGLAFGLFQGEILIIIGMNLLAFLIWLSLTSFAGVVFGSNAMSLMMAFAVWLAQHLLSYHEWVAELTSSRVAIWTVDALYYIFPKTGQISDMSIDLAIGRAISWMPLWSSFIFAAAIFIATAVVFRRKDY